MKDWTSLKIVCPTCSSNALVTGVAIRTARIRLTLWCLPCKKYIFWEATHDHLDDQSLPMETSFDHMFLHSVGIENERKLLEGRT